MSTIDPNSDIKPQLDLDSDIEDSDCEDDYQSQVSDNFSDNTNMSFDPNGIPFDIYKTLNDKSRMTLQQCQYCQKFYSKGTIDFKSQSYKNGMVTYDYDQSGDAVCYHCLYMLNYNKENPEIRLNFDGAFGKTIAEYIIECKDTHNQSECSHRDECFICDYIDGKEIIGIYGGEELYEQCKPNIISDESTKVDEFSLNICI